LALEAAQVGHLEYVGFGKFDAVNEGVDALHDLWCPKCLD
jgi:hypothetical protein